MEVKLALQRTFDPKFSHYICDGGGRDTYIISNNGGLMTTKNPISPLKGNNLAKYNYCTPAPRSDSWGLTYHSDGSGRDHYITHNSGGLYSRFSPGSDIKHFKESLRKPIRRVSNDLFTKTTQRWVDLRGRKTLMKNQEVVGNVVKRLFSPSPDNKLTKSTLKATI